jgi:hypothetical protein
MATIVKKKKNKKGKKKSLTPLQKLLLKGPVMTRQQWEEYKKDNKRASKWKISQ